MLRSKPSSMPQQGGSQHIDTLISAHARFKGELSFEGTVRIDGKFEGNIRSSQDGTLIISETADVQGEINVPNLLLYGTIRGNVRATKSLQVGAKGRLNGDVEYTVLSLNEGAAINGRCTRIEEKATQEAGANKQEAKQESKQAPVAGQQQAQTA